MNAQTTQHTPGPWRFDPIQRGTLNMLTGESSEMVPDGFAITAVEPKMFGGTRIVKNGLNEADARLIAAAPDLLAALKLIEAGYVTHPEIKAICRAAIAKATV